MKKYYVSKTTANPGNNHEVHTIDCQWVPKVENRIYLGEFSNCADAVKEAKKHYSDVNGCKTCCSACHRG